MLLIQGPEGVDRDRPHSYVKCNRSNSAGQKGYLSFGTFIICSYIDTSLTCGPRLPYSWLHPESPENLPGRFVECGARAVIFVIVATMVRTGSEEHVMMCLHPERRLRKAKKQKTPVKDLFRRGLGKNPMG